MRLRVAAGDRDGTRQVCSDLLARFGNTTDPDTADTVAWSCVLAPGAIADADAPVKLAELAVKGFADDQKHYGLNTLGAALFSAGRFEDAMRALAEGIQLRRGERFPQDWAFLAMARHRLGQRDQQARRALDRLRNHHPSADPSQFSNELEIRLLRSEAEALIIYDPVFPADPFAR